MAPPRGEGMTGSPPSGPALPMRARAGDPTGVRSSNPTHSPDRLTSFLLRHHKPAPNDGVDVKDLRPLTRSAYRADPGPRRRNRRCPKAAEDERKKINQPWDGTAWTGPVLSGMTVPNFARLRLRLTYLPGVARPPCSGCRFGLVDVENAEAPGWGKSPREHGHGHGRRTEARDHRNR
jgi:hypothetical protein